MFSFIKQISRLYALVLVTLSIIVAFASITIVSLVHSHDHYQMLLSNITAQRNLAQHFVIEINAFHFANDNRQKNHALIRAEQDIKELKSLFLQFNLLKKHLEEDKFSLFGFENIMSPHKTPVNIQKHENILDITQYMSLFISYGDTLLSELKPQTANNFENYTKIPAIFDQFQEHLNGLGLSRLSVLYKKIKDKNDDNFRFHKNLLLLCITLFICLILFEFLLIYRPFSKRLKEKENALQEEQDVISSARQNLERTQERLSLAMRGADIGIFEWTIDKDKFYLSPISLQILEKQHDDEERKNGCYLTKNEFKSLFHTQEQALFEKNLDAHIKHNKSFNMNLRLARDDQTQSTAKDLWINIKGQATWNDMGQAVCFAGMIKDVTLEKHNEDLKRIFMSGVEASNLPMAIIDVSHFGRQFLYASPGFCDLLGFEQDQILRGNMYMLNGPNTKLEHIDRVEAIFDSGKKGEIELTHYRSEGTPFIDKMSLIPITEENSARAIAYVTFHEDMSEHSTHDNKDIERQRNEAIGHLVKSTIPETLSSLYDIQQIVTGSDKEKIDRLIAVHKSLSGFYATQTQNNAQIDIAKVLPTIIADNQALYPDNFEITLDMGLMKSDFTAYVSETELRQILFNITANAATACKDKKALITISAEAIKLSFVEAEKRGLPAQNQDYALIRICDNGCGIRNEIIGNVFDPLFSNWKNFKSTGLGLTVARTLLKSWGGQITIENQDIEGVCVTCYIPIFKSQEDKDFMEMADLLDELNDGISNPY